MRGQNFNLVSRANTPATGVRAAERTGLEHVEALNFSGCKVTTRSVERTLVKRTYVRGKRHAALWRPPYGGTRC